MSASVASLPMGLRTCSIARDGFDVGHLRQAREAGFELVELSFNRPAQGISFDDQVKAEALRTEAEALGITFVSHAPDEFWLSNPDRAELAETIRAAERVVQGASMYGARAMVIHCCPGKAVVPGRAAEQLDAVGHALESLAPACERGGVRLAAETMIPGRVTSSVENLITAVERVDSPWVGICVDTNHANLSQDLNDAVRLAGSRIVEFHLNDNHFVKEEHLLPYAGAIDWAAFARAVVSIDYEGYMIMEPGGQYGDGTDLLTAAHEAADRLAQDLAVASE
ncbi:MAG TPA: sugar phosphate isomerase/epimerase family protein [Candidatus Latescibacteria bacterium]|nr:sugar phosphate isomerase/epimerase family protein [Candidatus Latescibacterota bacterium]HJP33808.1 sugar phosphate isomerase/epimerase family protein [Candidatus Latescibacterota bacterium]